MISNQIFRNFRSIYNGGIVMEKKNIDWGNIGFAYMPTDMRYVANFKDGKWDEGGLTADSNVVIRRMCWLC